MDGGAWWAAVHGVARSRTRLSDFTLFFHFHALEKEMGTHFNILAWRIPGTEEPGGLPSMRLHRVRHDSSDLAAAAALGSPGATPASLTTACHREGSRVTPLLPSPPHPPPPVSGLDPGCLDGREWGMPGQPPLPSHGQRLHL